MKFLLFYRIVLVAAVAVASPLVLRAGNGNIDKPMRKEFAESILTIFQDSIPVRKKTGDKSRDRVDKPSQDVQDERLKEAGRAIKQVPRSVPKLKPQPVTERPAMRRPPMKAPKKGFGGPRF